MRRMGIGLQLFTLRDVLAQDFEGTLRQVAELGYEGVEFAGYGGMSAEELSRLLQELNLKAIGAHVGIAKLREDLQGEIAYLKAIGAKYIICPWLGEEDRGSSEAWERVIEEFKTIGAACREQGLVFGYHNHAFEFEVKVGSEFAFDAVYGSTPAESVVVEMDTGWVQFAGQDALAYINRYAGRLPLVHLKDYRKDENGGMVTLELGEGELDLPAIIQASSDAGAEWLIVEQDRCQNPPLQSVATSIEWLKKHYLVHV
ncbi:sugar phosphate isomerase/epimerase family protein [Paenibacillus ginsengihumi]|jgi:sugar phosphate isomerase/epimerase|uniref:sugar phosphate isomerase/epimerase family protein n=1 Tax=Paenibacillus ginsengihumi TaxID=431596 RepID=UPI000381B01D|nr:sugar phosphate isomerase/epimerase [Paenibacillus ginsengihumi]